MRCPSSAHTCGLVPACDVDWLVVVRSKISSCFGHVADRAAVRWVLFTILAECASSSSGAELTERRKRRCDRATSSRQPAGGSPARGDARVPGSAAPGVGRDPGVEAGRGATGQSAASSEACGVVRNPRASGPRGSRACIPVAKAMDGTWEPGAGAKEPSGVGGVEWSEGCRGNWRGPRWPRACGVREASAPITGDHREVAGGYQGVGGGRSTA